MTARGARDGPGAAGAASQDAPLPVAPLAAPLAAAIQLDSRDDEAGNFARVEALCAQARARGARLVALPENVLYEGPDGGRRHPLETWGPRFGALARALEVTLVAGSVREPVPGDPARAWNTTVAYGPDGAALARYRKIHLFDVDVPGGPVERESDVVAPGRDVVVFEAPGLGPVGLAICYDLRFPELFRALADRGARLVVLPSSFAAATGRAHWEVLVRARAIEDQLWVVAPDQAGLKPHGRPKYGHSMIVDPWGTVVARAREVEEDVVVAALDLAQQDRVRAAMPVLAHRRPLPPAAG